MYKRQCSFMFLHVPSWSSMVLHGPYCLLYTSDAADELDGVDLGGRRIIKKQLIKCRY
ncbi:hypothetical protein JMUB7518_28070 [Staphylococcus aureus]